ncbi:PD-(D/E)XK nuclease family protein [Bacillus mesophilum]|uniref:PD-(D/E)XK nuclease family protein n=1 Tax=Bacillus mesophilum TaxID=1071718 RepID=A0A7V7UWL3_9BACI|nr:PD-(D/E)XK nuclease family protein [Bacillus mesophilum]KAB2331285.1 PD-(D/E)XK nuclease family protein [Bacillus mesophilum]
MSYSFDLIAQLDHSKEFAHLHKKFHQFNPLKVLRVNHYEIRHSNVLAWLLDPEENHQFGSFFIKKVFSRLLIKNENEEKLVNIDFLQILSSSLTDTLVSREVKTSNGRYIDLLLEVPSLKVLLVIENKFHASESENQLIDYLKYVSEQYKGYTIIPVYLTLTSDIPSHPEYWSLDYHDILDIISQHLELNQEVIADNIHDFLTYYIAILQEELVEDNQAIQMALEVYQKNKVAIDILYISQHPECRKLPRFKDIYTQIDKLSLGQQLALKRLYDKKKKTIDYVFTNGSNVLRQAFISFLEREEIPEEFYSAHVRVPNFILPEWADFEDILGKPELGYWLGHGLIIWFERTWDDFLKVNVEVGPVPYENRLNLLNALETLGVSFRTSAKLEGKKYTKIYTETSIISDWANKESIAEGMIRLFNDDKFNNLLRCIAIAIERLTKLDDQQGEDELNEVITLDINSTKSRIISKSAFIKFAKNHGITSDLYKIKNHDASFIIPIFRALENKYGVSRIKWWWHDSTFTFWYERLKDDRLKLTLELGPLNPEKRLLIIEQLEEMGVVFSVKSKLPSASYTRIFSKSVVIQNWEDDEEVYHTMEILYNDSKNQRLIELIYSLE